MGHLDIVRMTIIASKTLLQLAHIQQSVRSDTPAQLSNQSHVFTDVTRQFPEFGKIFYESLHIRNRLNRSITFRLRLVLFDILFDVSTKVAKVEVHVFLEEGVLILRQYDFSEFWSDIRHVTQVNFAIVDSE